MKKFFKWVGIGIIAIIGFLILDIIVYVIFGRSLLNDGSNVNTEQAQQTEQTEESNPNIKKPDNYIDNLNMDDTIQKGYNQRMMLIGHFEREDMPAEEKIQFAQETLQRIEPEIRTMLYDMRDGDAGTLYIYVSNAYGSIRNMAEDTIEYYQDGNEEAKTEFYDQSDRALDQLQKADKEINK